MDKRKTTIIYATVFFMLLLVSATPTGVWTKTKDDYVMSCIDIEPIGVKDFVEWKVTYIDYKCLSKMLALELTGDNTKIVDDVAYVSLVSPTVNLPIKLTSTDKKISETSINLDTLIKNNIFYTYSTSYDKVSIGLATEEWEIIYYENVTLGLCDSSLWSEYANCTPSANWTVQEKQVYANITSNETFWNINGTTPTYNVFQLWTSIHSNAYNINFTIDNRNITYNYSVNNLVSYPLLNSTIRQEIPIIINSVENKTNFEYNILVPYNTDMRSDFGDIEIYDTIGNVLPHWIETYINDTNASVWFKFNLSAINDVQAYIVFGNHSKTGVGNVENVYDYIDNFDSEDWTTRTGTATVSAGIMTVAQSSEIYDGTFSFGNNTYTEFKAIFNPSPTANWNAIRGEQTPADATDTDSQLRYMGISSVTKVTTRLQGVGETNTDTTTSSAYRIYAIKWLPSKVEYLINDVSIANHTTNIPTQVLFPDVYQKASGVNILVDWWRTRTYIENMPTYSLGEYRQFENKTYNIEWTTGWAYCTDNANCTDAYFCDTTADVSNYKCVEDLTTEANIINSEYAIEGNVTIFSNYLYDDTIITDGTGIYSIGYRNGTFIEEINATYNPLTELYENIYDFEIGEYKINVSFTGQPYYANASDTLDLDVIFLSLNITNPLNNERLYSSTVYPALVLVLPDFYLTGSCRWIHNTKTTSLFTVTNNATFDNYPLKLINNDNVLTAECLIGDISITKNIEFTTTAVPDPYLLGINLNTHLVVQAFLQTTKEFLFTGGKSYMLFMIPISIIMMFGYLFIRSVNNVTGRDKEFKP